MTSQSHAERGSTGASGPVGGPSSSHAVTEAEVERCASLSQGQLEVLRLVNRHLSSKEIATRLAISSHTVDQRVRGAIRRLGVTRRSEAARLVDAFDRSRLTADEPEPAPYQRLIHQPPDIDAGPAGHQTDVAVSFQIRHADRTEGVGAERFETEQRSVRIRSPLFPWSTPQQPSNGWKVGTRLAAILGIAVATSFSAGMLLAGLESLSRMIQP